MQRLAPAFSVLFLMVATTACNLKFSDWDWSDSSPPPPMIERTDIESEDQDAIYPGAKASWGIYPKDAPAKRGLLTPGAFADWPPFHQAEERVPPTTAGASGASSIDSTSETNERPARRRSRVQPTLSLDFDYTVGLDVSDRKGLGAFDYIEFEGVQTFGPTEVDYDYDLHLGTVFLRAGVRFFDVVSLEGLGGVSISGLDMQVSTPTTQTTQTVVGYGGNVGARLTVTPHPVVDLYAQYQMHFLGSPQDDQGAIGVSVFDAIGQVHVTSNLSVFAGWRTLRYGGSVDDASNIEIKELGGPTFGGLLRY